LLRKLNINFYAYSPIAGGFLAKTSAQLRSNETEGRFGEKSFLGDMYNELYGKPSLYEGLDDWGEIARDAGISKAALAYRWVVYHSAMGEGDGVVVGARHVGQLEETLKAIEEGPLEEGIAERASGVWEKVKRDAPRDNWNDYLSSKI
jgi:aflatoxin B1 aldehyde reductase